jgi:hypothetical protein
METTWHDLETPLQTLLEFQSGASDLSADHQSAVEKKARADISKALDTLERHLLHRTYMVGERVSVADISLCCAVAAIADLGLLDAIAYPSVLRWLMTVSSLPEMKETLGDISTSKSQGDFAFGKWTRRRTRIVELLSQGESAIGKHTTVKGWVRTSRSAEKGRILFLELTDGSTVRGLQVVLDVEKCPGAEAIVNSGGVGASVSIYGTVVASPAKGQLIELHAISGELLGAVYGGENGEVGGKNYPMAKKQHSLEFLREKAHLRARSKVFSSAMRLRNAMAYATHKFFYERGFVYTHTPLITGADCEGAGEMFTVTTLLGDHQKITDIPKTKTGEVDFAKDFFGRHVSLTVSGQLNVETHACALSDVYTFGPTFRAENSHTSRHLAEFWMIEPEICFADLGDDMALAVGFPLFDLIEVICVLNMSS